MRNFLILFYFCTVYGGSSEDAVDHPEVEGKEARRRGRRGRAPHARRASGLVVFEVARIICRKKTERKGEKKQCEKIGSRKQQRSKK